MLFLPILPVLGLVLDARNNYVGDIPRDVVGPFLADDLPFLILGKATDFATQTEPYPFFDDFPRTELDMGVTIPDDVCSIAVKWWWYLFYDQECLARDEPINRLRGMALLARRFTSTTTGPRKRIHFDCNLPLETNERRVREIQHSSMDVWRHCRLPQIERAMLGRFTIVCPENSLIVDWKCVKDEVVRQMNFDGFEKLGIKSPSGKLLKTPNLIFTTRCLDIVDGKPVYDW